MTSNPFDERFSDEDTGESFFDYMARTFELRKAFVRERVRDHLNHHGLHAPFVLYRFNDKKVRTIKTLQMAWISPSMRNPSKIQVTRAIWDGPFNDSLYPTYEKALYEAFQEGWRETTTRLLDRVAQTWHFSG